MQRQKTPQTQGFTAFLNLRRIAPDYRVGAQEGTRVIGDLKVVKN